MIPKLNYTSYATQLKKIRITGRKEGNPKWENGIFEKLFKKVDTMEEYWSIPKMQEWNLG